MSVKSDWLSRTMRLLEIDLPLRPRERPPPPEATLQRAQLPAPESDRIPPSEFLKYRLGLQPPLALEERLDLRPHLGKRFGARRPAVARFQLTGQLPGPPVFARRRLVNARLHGGSG
ncbi:MAG: hypothetical protein ACREXX_02645 [Gammaproteobacteria bacterium]